MRDYRKDFPIFKNNPDLVYLDSAATSQKPQVVIDAINEFYQEYNSNIHRGIYPIAEKATEKVEEVRRKIAKFIHAKSSEEIVFTHGTTESINLAMYSWGRSNVNKGDVVVSTITEHHANFVPWQQLVKEKGAEFYVIDIKEDGSLVLDLRDEKLKRARVLAISYVSSVLGKINFVSQIIKDVRKINKNIVVVVDGAQAIPFKPVDMQELDCDFFAFSGHKMFAETGVGVLYGKKALLEKMQPFLFGGNMIQEVAANHTSFAKVPTRFEAGTLNIAGIISLGAAIEYLTVIGMSNVKEYDRALVTYAFDELQTINDLTIHGPQNANQRGGIISFTMKGIHPHDIVQILGEKNICIRAGHHCAMPLHERLGIPASARVSVSIYNTKKDIDLLIQQLKSIQKLFS